MCPNAASTASESSFTDVSLPLPTFSTAPSSSGRVEHPHPRLHDVVDEDEVPRLLPVAVDRDRLVAQDVPDEDREDALVRVADALPRPVHVEHAQRRHGDIDVRPGPGHVHVALGRVLRDAVVGDRYARDILGRRNELGLAVGRHRARVDETRHAGLDASAQHVHGSDDVRPQVHLGLGEREPDARLPGDVEHGVEVRAREELVDDDSIGHIPVDEGRGRRNALADAGGQVVEDGDVESLAEQAIGQVRADEPGAAGHEHMSHPGGRARSSKISSSGHRDIPAGVVALQPAEVADVTDVVASPRLVDVLDVERRADQLLEPRDRFEDRDRVLATAAEVVDGPRARALREGERRGAHVRRVDVVADLLSLVPVDPVRATLAHAARQVGEEAVQLGTRVVRAREAAAAEADRRHAEVAPVLLHEEVRRRLRRAEEAVHASHRSGSVSSMPSRSAGSA